MAADACTHCSLRCCSSSTSFHSQDTRHGQRRLEVEQEPRISRYPEWYSLLPQDEKHQAQGLRDLWQTEVCARHQQRARGTQNSGGGQSCWARRVCSLGTTKYSLFHIRAASGGIPPRL